MLLLEGYKLERLGLVGEDTFDLLSTIQDSFGVTFIEDDLVRAVDIQSLANCLHKKLNRPLSEKCLSAVVFYKLRRTFISAFDTPRTEITPKMSLVKLLPWKGRKKNWRGIQDHLKYELPVLAWPPWLLALSIALVGLCLTLPALRWNHLASRAGSMAAILTLVAALDLWVLALVLLSPLARQFPKGCETFADLVELTLAHNYRTISSEHGMSPERELIDVLRQLIAVQTGLDIQKVSPETRFPEGLNIY